MFSTHVYACVKIIFCMCECVRICVLLLPRNTNNPIFELTPGFAIFLFFHQTSGFGFDASVSYQLKCKWPLPFWCYDCFRVRCQESETSARGQSAPLNHTVLFDCNRGSSVTTRSRICKQIRSCDCSK